LIALTTQPHRASRLVHFMKIKLAELLAPLGPAIALVIWTYDPRGYVTWFWYLIYFQLGAIGSYLGFYLLGLPAIRYLHKKNIYNLLTIIISGAITGVIAFFVIMFVFSVLLSGMATTIKSNLRYLDFTLALIGMAFGVMTAITYWSIDKLTTSSKVASIEN